MQQDDKNTAIYLGFEEYVPHDPALPERNLLRAILLTAMSDLKRPGEAQREAADFFMSTDESYVFSFVSICNHLDIDPKRVLMVTGLLPGHGPKVELPQQLGPLPAVPQANGTEG